MREPTKAGTTSRSEIANASRPHGEATGARILLPVSTSLSADCAVAKSARRRVGILRAGRNESFDSYCSDVDTPIFQTLKETIRQCANPCLADAKRKIVGIRFQGITATRQQKSTLSRAHSFYVKVFSCRSSCALVCGSKRARRAWSAVIRCDSSTGMMPLRCCGHASSIR
jgi:hypothetical protein